MKTNLPKPGTTCYVKDFEDAAWNMRTFWGVSKSPLLKYITYDKRSDEVEQWVIIKFVDEEQN
jgi:hypothetical protein